MGNASDVMVARRGGGGGVVGWGGGVWGWGGGGGGGVKDSHPLNTTETGDKRPLDGPPVSFNIFL